VAAMTRRTAPKKPKKEVVVEEPETLLCEVVDTPPTRSEPILGKCVECNLFDAHSAVDSLCYKCHRTKAGFIFDEDKKLWVKPKRGKF
jgi:hypothetical protein